MSITSVRRAEIKDAVIFANYKTTAEADGFCRLVSLQVSRERRHERLKHRRSYTASECFELLGLST